jgi:hypothetical protein
VPERNGGPATRALVVEIGRELVQLAQTEVDLARAELASNVRSGRRALVGLGVATMAALAGITLLLLSGVLGLATLMPGWLAALVVAGAVFGVGPVPATSAGSSVPVPRWPSHGSR